MAGQPIAEGGVPPSASQSDTVAMEKPTTEEEPQVKVKKRKKKKVCPPLMDGYQQSSQ